MTRGFRGLTLKESSATIREICVEFWHQCTMPRVGDQIDDVTLTRPDGNAVRLSEFNAGPLILIFLRYFA